MFSLIYLNEEENNLNNDFSIEIIKKSIEKAIVNEIFKKNIMDLSQLNNITKRLDEDIIKLENKLKTKKDMVNVVVKIPI